MHVFVLKAGSSITKRITGSDRFFYIFGSASVSGTVSATVNGHTVSIRETGACIALAACVSYNVDTIVKGILILVELGARPCHSEENTSLDWNTHDDLGDDTEPGTWQPAVGSSIINAVDTSLNTYDNVVLCLNSYYPISYSDNSSRRFETDLDQFNCMDSGLHALVSAHFNVDIVSTYNGRIPKSRAVVCSCVLDFNPSPTQNLVEMPLHTSKRSKIVAPLYGCGLTCNSESSGGAQQRGTILTALMVSRK